MRLVMMGTGGFALPTFQALLASPHQVVGLVTQPDRAVGKERASTRQTGPSLKDIALKRSLPVLQPESINTPEGVAALQAWQPDLLVVAAYGQILSRDLLAVSSHGGINVHASLLPKFRGAAPIAWAIYHGETHTGVTIIKMSVALDAGDMLAQATVAILPEETEGELEARLGPIGAKLALQVIEQVGAGTAQGIKQDKALVTKAPKLTKEHGLIDWNRRSYEVCNQIRAMHPWPTAYTYLHAEGLPPSRLIIHRAQSYPCQCADEPFGQIFEGPSGEMLVAAGETAPGEQSVVEILEVQPSGKRRMSVKDFLRGRAIDETAWFGPEQA